MRELSEITNLGIEKLKELGGSTAVVSASRSVTHEFNVDGGEFSLFRTLFGNSLHMTVIKDGKRGTYAANKTDDEAINEAARQTVAIAEGADADKAWEIAPDGGYRLFKEGCEKPDLDKLFFRCRELVDYIKNEHPLIIIEQMIATHVEKHSFYENTNGARYETNGGEYALSLMFSAHDGDECSSFFETGFVTETLDKSFRALGSVDDDIKSVEKQIHTKSVSEKFVATVVLTPDTFAEFLDSAIGNFCGERVVLDKTAKWLDKVGSKVVDERISVKYPVRHEGVVGCDSYTGEGFLCEDYTLIDKGVLTSLPLSLYVANKTGNKPIKSGMGIMIVPKGEKSLDEIIKSIDKGLIVGRFSGGSPGISGEFSGVAKNSFLIENGKITDAVSETMISGNLADMFNSLVDISSDTICDGASEMPYAAFSGITVSGKQ